MIFPDRFGLYGILTDPVRGYEYLTEVMVELEVAVIQLGDKRLGKSELMKMAEETSRVPSSTACFLPSGVISEPSS